MRLLLPLFFLTLIAGQLGAIPLGRHVRLFPHELIMVVLFAVSLPALKRNKSFPRLVWWIVAFALAALFSTLSNATRFVASEVGVAVLYLVRWLLYAGLYWISSLSLVPSRVWIRWLYVSGIVTAWLGLGQYVLYPDLRNLYYLGWDPHYWRVFSTLLDPNFTGIIMVLTLFAGFVIKRKITSWLWYLGQGSVFIAFLLTYSRGSYLAFVGALLFLIYLRSSLRRLAVVLVLTFGAFLLFLPRAGEGQNLLRTTSSLARLGSWRYGLELIRQSPLFGHGFNTLGLLPQTANKLQYSLDGRLIPSHAAWGIENSFLFVGATSGLLGLSIYLGMLGKMLRIGCIFYNHKKEAGAIYLAALVSVLVHSMFVNSLFYPWVMVWVWVLTGVTEQMLSSGN